MIHVCTKDTSQRASKLQKLDSQTSVLKDSNIGQAFILGSIPTFSLGMGQFSRLLSWNNWSSSACSANGVDFIDNFNVFWDHMQLFIRGLGAQMLSNIQHSVCQSWLLRSDVHQQIMSPESSNQKAIHSVPGIWLFDNKLRFCIIRYLDKIICFWLWYSHTQS